MLTTRKEMPLGPGAARRGIVTKSDGWYIDLDTLLPCEQTPRDRGVYLYARAYVVSEKPRALPVPIFENIGEPETGFAIARIL